MSFAALFLLLAAHTDWNVVNAVAPGTEVRIAAGSRDVRGRVTRSTDASLVLTSDKGEEVFDRQQVSRVLVKKQNHRKRNILIGLGVGAGGGLGVGLSARAKPDQLHFISNGAVVGIGAAAGAAVGAVVGAVIPTGGWREIYRQ